LLNHIGSKAEEEVAKDYLQDTNYTCLPIALPEKVSFRQVQNEGKAITEVTYQSLRHEAKKLIESILEYI
jgi:hypothetical protein